MTTTPFTVPSSAVEALEDPALALLVRTVLSHYMTGGKRAFGPNPGRLSHMLARYSKVEVKRAGVLCPAPIPALEHRERYPHPDAALQAFGLSTVTVVEDIWPAREAADGITTTLDDDMLEAFLVPELWPVVAAVILDGPGLANERFERALRLRAMETVPQTRRREDAEPTVAQSTLDAEAYTAMALLGVIVQLRHRGFPAPGYLADWTATPRMDVPKGAKSPTDTTAVPRVLLRRTWQGVCADVEKRLGPPSHEKETIANTSVGRLRNTLVPFMALRARTLLGILATVGARGIEVHQLTVGDYNPKYRQWDGLVGPALCIRPEKTFPGEQHWKCLPDELARMIETWLLYLDKLNGGPRPKTAPFFVTSQDHLDRPWKTAQMRQKFSGDLRKNIKALLPKDPLVPTYGYTLHPVRSAAAQMLRSTDAMAYMTAHDLDADQHWVAEALTSHALKGMDALYGGASKILDRERLSRIGTEVSWALLTTDWGARKTYDKLSYRESLDTRKSLYFELDTIRKEIDALFAKTREAGDTNQALTDLLNAQHLMLRQQSISDDLRKTELHLEKLKLDPRYLVAISDHEPDTGWRVKLADIEREVLGREDDGTNATTRTKKVRSWISVKEVGQLAGHRTPSTARNWTSGKHLPFAPGDPRRPWEPDRIPIDASCGERRKKIIVAGINRGFLTPERREELTRMLSEAPEENWSQEHLRAPLQYPDWLKQPGRRAKTP